MSSSRPSGHSLMEVQGIGFRPGIRATETGTCKRRRCAISTPKQVHIRAPGLLRLQSRSCSVICRDLARSGWFGLASVPTETCKPELGLVSQITSLTAQPRCPKLASCYLWDSNHCLSNCCLANREAVSRQQPTRDIWSIMK